LETTASTNESGWAAAEARWRYARVANSAARNPTGSWDKVESPDAFRAVKL
jgi:hypothetical protein